MIRVTRIIKKMPLTPKQIAALLESHGFKYISSNGSHRKYRRLADNKTIIVPFHSADLKKGTERSILKAAGLLNNRK